MAAIFPVTGDMAAGNLATTDSYSGQFIPELWSKKLADYDWVKASNLTADLKLLFKMISHNVISVDT